MSLAWIVVALTVVVGYLLARVRMLSAEVQAHHEWLSSLGEAMWEREIQPRPVPRDPLRRTRN